MIVDPVMERQSPDKKLFVAAGSTATVPLYKQFIYVAGGSPATDLTLPNVNEAEGRKYTFTASSIAATTGSVINIDYSNGAGTTLTSTISTAGVEVSFESIGGVWHIVR